MRLLQFENKNVKTIQGHSRSLKFGKKILSIYRYQKKKNLIVNINLTIWYQSLLLCSKLDLLIRLMIFNVFMYFWELTKIFWIKVTRVLGLISVFQQAAKVALVRQITKRNTLPFPITKVLSKSLNISRKKARFMLKVSFLKNWGS